LEILTVCFAISTRSYSVEEKIIRTERKRLPEQLFVSIFQSEDERGMSKSGACASAPMKSAYVSMCFKVEVIRLAVHKFIISV
jgi:hypothetical protein